ncbi:MAG: TlpA family protein disulfide reductase [Thermoanaerobaculia bacterium]
MTRDWEAEPQLVTVTHDQWRRELEAMHGRVVVVDNWATWCKPCIERFPAMLELEKKWGPHGVMFVTLSLDDRDDPDSIEQVRGFLLEQDARIPNYLMDEIIPDAFDQLGLLGIPAVFIYDESGTMAHRLTGDDPNRQFTEADVDEAIHALVGGQSTTESAEVGTGFEGPRSGVRVSAETNRRSALRPSRTKWRSVDAGETRVP